MKKYALIFSFALALGKAHASQIVNPGGSGSGGSSVYPATATASFPFGLSVSTMTTSTQTVNGQITINSQHATGSFTKTVPSLIMFGTQTEDNAMEFDDTDSNIAVSTNPAIGFQKILGAFYIGQRDPLGGYSGTNSIQLDYTDQSNQKFRSTSNSASFDGSLGVGGSGDASTFLTVNDSDAVRKRGLLIYNGSGYQLVVTTTGLVGIGGSSLTINGVAMNWPSSGTLGGYLQYVSSNTLQWTTPAGGGSSPTTSTNTWTAPNTFTNSIILASATASGDEYSYGTLGSSATIDWTKGNAQNVALTTNATLTFSAPPHPCSLTLFVTQGSGPFAITWPATVKWPAGAAPTLSPGNGAQDSISCRYRPNGNYDCQWTGNYS